MKPIITLDKVSFSYGRQPIIEDLSLTVYRGDFMAIIGPNGGGKTTLIRLILGFLSPECGSIRVLNTSPQQASTNIGYVPQSMAGYNHIPVSVANVIMSGALNRGSIGPFFSKAIKNKAQKMMEKVHIEDISNQRIYELSGGQRQRTLIARALMADPQILVLDEPTASVDPKVEKDIYEILRVLNENTTILLVSHDIAFVSSYVNTVTCLNRTGVTHNIEDVRSTDLTKLYSPTTRMIDHQCKL